MNKLPVISVITVSYNAISTIEDTILSVINQTYPHIEYIIIDGGSTDGTVEILKKYADNISFWVSESDQGIFDAMNKGINKSTGMWINFMNSGDVFYNEKVLFDLFSSGGLYCVDNYDVVYGDVFAIKSFGETYSKSAKIDSIRKNMPFCHQASFCRASVLGKSCFNLHFKLCADYNLFYQLYKSGNTFLQISIPIAYFDACNGVSSINKRLLMREVAEISNRQIFAVRFEYFLRMLKQNFIKIRKYGA